MSRNLAMQPITLTVRTIPCEVVKGNFHKLEDLTPHQLAAAKEKFRGPLENFLYLIAEDGSRVIARQHVSTFSFAELDSIGAV